MLPPPVPLGTVMVTLLMVPAVAVLNEKAYVTPVLPVCELLTDQLTLVSVPAKATDVCKPSNTSALSTPAAKSRIWRLPVARAPIVPPSHEMRFEP